MKEIYRQLILAVGFLVLFPATIVGALLLFREWLLDDDDPRGR